MRWQGRKWRGWAGLLAVALLAVLYAPGMAGAATTGAISGTVTAAVGHAPVQGVLVCAWTLDEEDLECDLTAPDGTYTITELQPGGYKVDFSDFSGTGYVGQYYNAKPSWVAAEVVAVASGSTTTGIDAELVLGGKITGTVTDAVTESGIPGFNVCASSGVYEECDETTATGEYTIAGLPEGDYIVYFEFFDDSDYVNQYYNGQPSWEVANPVHVTSGETASNINAELQKGGRIAGTVTKAIDGTLLGGIEVCAHEDRAPNYWAVRCTKTTANGQYTIHGLATGNYKVEFSPDWPGEPGDEFPAQFFNDKSSLTEAEWVGVTAPGTTTGIDGHLGPKPTQPVVMPPTTTTPVTQPPPAKARIVVKLSAPTQRLSVIRKSGVIGVRCRLSAAGRCVVVATIRAKDAKALGLKIKEGAKSLTIGRGKARLGKAGSARVKVKLSRKVLKALKGASNLRFRLAVTASGPGHKASTRSVNLTAWS